LSNDFVSALHLLNCILPPVNRQWFIKICSFDSVLVYRYGWWPLGSVFYYTNAHNNRYTTCSYGHFTNN